MREGGTVVAAAVAETAAVEAAGIVADMEAAVVAAADTVDIAAAAVVARGQGQRRVPSQCELCDGAQIRKLWVSEGPLCQQEGRGIWVHFHFAGIGWRQLYSFD